MKALFQVALWSLIIVPLMIMAYNTVTFEFEGATADTFSDFVRLLRQELKSKEVRGFPVTKEKIAIREGYVLAKLQINNEDYITFAINLTNAYIEAYCDRYQQKDRANFLADTRADARDYLFEGASVRNIPFGGSYTVLERENFAGKRENTELGVDKLRFAVQSVYGKPPARLTNKIEGKFFLVSIQMLSETTRFQYILDKVLKEGTATSYKPDPKALKLENKWGLISEAIQNTKSDGIISPPLHLTTTDNERWTVNKVEDIVPDIGLLKFNSSASSVQELEFSLKFASFLLVICFLS